MLLKIMMIRIVYLKILNKMIDRDSLETARLLKEALKIVDELAKSDLVDVDYPFEGDDFDYLKLQELINKAKKLKKNRLWKLS